MPKKNTIKIEITPDGTTGNYKLKILYAGIEFSAMYFESYEKAVEIAKPLCNCIKSNWLETEFNKYNHNFKILGDEKKI